MAASDQRNIVLTGFMGTGKTRVGIELARRLGRKLVDVDTEIERTEGVRISDIFAQRGEAGFREIETAKVREISLRSGLIVSTGGGVVLKDENMEALREKGVIVCVTASPETILERTGKRTNRPLLDVADPMARIVELLEERRPFYENADITVATDGKTPIQVAEEILDALRWKK